MGKVLGGKHAVSRVLKGRQTDRRHNTNHRRERGGKEEEEEE